MIQRLVDKVIEYFIEGNYDYASNSFVEGSQTKLTSRIVDTEVFTFNALHHKIVERSKNPLDREHATAYMWKNPKIFKLGTYQNKEDLSSMRWTVDYAQDLEFVRQFTGD